MGFPTQNDHFGVFWGYHHLRKHLDIVIDPLSPSGLNIPCPKIFFVGIMAHQTAEDEQGMYNHHVSRNARFV